MSEKFNGHLFSIVLIGDSSVGKSCLLKKFAEPERQLAKGHTATVGVDFVVRQLDVGKEKVKLSVWDTAGQERFRSITNAYFRGSMGAIVVYDVTDENTFDSASHWIEEFRTKARQGAPIILAANKMDMYDEKCRVNKSKGQELAMQDINCCYMETSAVTGVGIQPAFELVCEQIIAHRKNSAHQSVQLQDAPYEGANPSGKGRSTKLEKKDLGGPPPKKKKGCGC